MNADYGHETPLEGHIKDCVVWGWDPFVASRTYTPEALKPYRARIKAEDMFL